MNFVYNINYPSTYSKEILPNSIDEKNLRSFIECFQNVEYVQNFTTDKAIVIIQLIEHGEYHHLLELYSESAIEYINSEQVLEELMENPKIKDIISVLKVEETALDDISVHPELSASLITVGGTVTQQLLTPYIGIFVSLLFLAFIFSRGNKIISKDSRRTILNVILFLPDSTRKEICLKISDNTTMIPDYKYEATIYRELKRYKAVDILEFYGDAERRSVRNILGYNNLEVNIDNINIPSFTIEVDNTNNYYCFAMESLATTKFNELEYYLELYKKRERQRQRDSFRSRENQIEKERDNLVQKRLLQAIMDSVSNLNRNFGFFHGDLKDDNVMINESTHRVKNFDFDFSGFVNIPDKNVTINKYPIKFNSITPPNFYHPTTEEGFIKLSNILYFYDIYRLLISVYFGQNIHFINDTNIYRDITVNNRSIRINLGEIITYLGANLKYKTVLSSIDEIRKQFLAAKWFPNEIKSLIARRETLNNNRRAGIFSQGLYDIDDEINEIDRQIAQEKIDCWDWNNTICSGEIVMQVYSEVAKDMIRR